MQKAVQDMLDKLTENCKRFREHMGYKKQQQG
jgi:hypothetical protein